MYFSKSESGGPETDLSADDMVNVSEADIAEKLGTIQDQRGMIRMGKKQELRRNFHFFSIWGFAAIIILVNSNYTIHTWQTALLAWAVVVTAILFNTVMFRKLPMLEVTLVFCLGNLDSATNSPTGQPYVEVLLNATQSTGAKITLVTVMLVLLITCAVNTVTTSSRQLWSFARDGGPPCSAWLARVRPAWDIYMICIACILQKRIRGEPFPASRFDLGKTGNVVNVIAMSFLLVAWIFQFFPSAPNPTGTSMNWPWNEWLCQSGRYPYPHFYLTWTEGAPRARSAIEALLADAEHQISALIAHGHGDSIIPNAPSWLVSWMEQEDLTLVVWQRRKGRTSGYERFTVEEAGGALQLVRRCGVQRGFFGEVWAMVWKEGRQIGYVWFARTDLGGGVEGKGEGNGTAGFWGFDAS
ncbi:MAG: hypothetical protein Q9202_007085 [Teloschistes flavicans]